MTASLASIRPFQDGQYNITSRNVVNGQTFSLATFDGSAVGLSSDRASPWFLQWMPTRGSYRIWAHGTNNVLDATQIENANVTTWRSNNRDWQQWAIRLQIDSRRPSNDPNRVAGYTITPISQPVDGALTMGGLTTRIPLRPAQIRPAPSADQDIGRTQLWNFSFLRRTVEEGQPQESVEEEPESSHSEKAWAPIEEAK